MEKSRTESRVFSTDVWVALRALTETRNSRDAEAWKGVFEWKR